MLDVRRVILVGAFVAAGCGKNPRYCDQSTECGDPSYVCDLAGVCPESEGLTNSCIPPEAICWDGGGPPAADASMADADLNPDAAPCSSDTTCEFGCNESAGICNECNPSTVECGGSTLVTCDENGLITDQDNCGLGCHPNGTRCYDLDPSNDLALYLDQTDTAPDVVLTDGATIDTDTGDVINGDSSEVTIPTQLLAAPTDGVEVRVLMVKSITFNDVTVNGTAALAIVADGLIEVRGTLDLAGGLGLTAAGPGAYSCPASSGTLSGGSTASGSGGGGFGGAGGRGGNGNGAGGGLGGGVDGNVELVPLRGGCEGGPILGGGSFGTQGYGGGAIQMSSRTAISVVLGSDAGQINVGGGGGSTEGDQAGIRGGTGGGSGGAILLEAPVVTVANGAGLGANGGGGGCFGASPAGPGTVSLSPTPGADCNSSSYGDGGTGASVAAPTAGNGEDATVVGGGGGGGIGRIRINTSAGTFSPAGSAIVSPTPSVGTAGRR